ncbi:Flp pilus assembly protein CpaB [Eggerthella lenta DSM 2243]|uniref:Flp pilus assembly protein CpaB n=3 Tax=Eggerthella lenta TaxID=84112 RepID=C8WHY1_EGGLE|nr:Flp pilus assembly protein CpaB [Eggerthella lenta DSM 2243]
MFNKRKSSSDNQASKAQPGHFREAGEGEESGSSARKLSLVTAASVAIAVIAVVYAFLTSSNVQSEIATLRENTSSTVITTTAISQGTTISPDMLKVVDIPASFLNSEAIADTQDLVGKIALYNIAANSQVTSGMLSAMDNAATLASSLQAGNVAISIAVDSESGLSGLIKQNDYVDILGNGEVIVQNVRVAALDSNLSGSVSQYATVTLEVAPTQATAIQEAQSENPLRFVLRPAVERTAPGV